MRRRSDGGEITPYQRPCGLLSRRAKTITARATGLRLRRIFPKAEKPPIATLSLMQFALSAVIFGLRRDEGRQFSALRAGSTACGASNKGLGKENEHAD
jgi:hypothetical protein